MSSIRILDGHVAHERLDDEVVVINLDTGAYYALDGPSADCWTLLAHGTPLSETANVLAERHAVDHGAIAREVDALAAELVREGLAAWDPNGPGSAEPPSVLPERPVERAGAGTELRIEKYDDLEELLLLDPIHEVDASGWPALPAESA